MGAFWNIYSQNCETGISTRQDKLLKTKIFCGFFILLFHSYFRYKTWSSSFVYEEIDKFSIFVI